MWLRCHDTVRPWWDPHQQNKSLAQGKAEAFTSDETAICRQCLGKLSGYSRHRWRGFVVGGTWRPERSAILILRRNSTSPKTACTYTIGKNDAAFRSPEEYIYEPQTSAIDVYALGSILYELLTGNEVWHDTDTKDAQQYIIDGKLPEISEEIVSRENPVDLALKEAISMCYVYEPKDRASAVDVASFLKSKLSELSVD